MIQIAIPIKPVRRKMYYFGHKGDTLQEYQYGMRRVNKYRLRVFQMCIYNGITYHFLAYRTPFTERELVAFFVNGVLQETDMN